MKKLIGSQIFRYVITGGFTTVVDYIIYIGLTALEVNYLAANTAAWAGAVIFAFFANRNVVLHSDGNRAGEFFKFISLRLCTLAAENLLLMLLIDHLGAGNLTAKLTVSVVTVILNYCACKYGIFKKEEA